MANGVGVETAALFRESSVSNVKISLAEATAAFQRTAAALMAAHTGDGFQKVMYTPPTATAGPRIATTTAAGESLKPALTSKTGISFVIPKNKLSGALVPVVRNVAGKWEPDEGKKKEDDVQLLPQRKTRWGIDLTQDPVVRRGRALALQTRAEQIAAQLESGQLDIDTNEGTRSPSPPPIYDSNGQRTNTREGRRREELELERREAIGECLQLNPSYKPPSGYKPVYKEAKLYIPVKDYPGYNFIGLILGPRGNTQKRMEAETGSKIAIRGKGAVKEGKKSSAVRLQGGRRDAKEADGAFEDLHVHITADSVEKVDAAVALIEPLLTPVDEDRNTHKRKQLRELAEMNGTMRDFPKACSVCGETGHREWHCPKDKLYSFQAKVWCQTCGDGGHPTIDCPTKQSGQGKALDKEYLSFLEELGNGISGASAGSTQGLPSKSAVEESIKEETQVVPSTSATATGPTEISETSLDPNQLADVISGPQPMLITASGPQPMPPAWSSVFPIGFEARVGPQQENFVQVEGDRQFRTLPNDSRPPMLAPSTSAFNVYPTPFPHPGHPPTFGSPPVFHGQPPSINLTMGGLPGPPNVGLASPGPYGLQRVSPIAESSSLGGRFAGNEGASGFVQFPVPPKGPTLGPGPPHIPNPSFPEVAQSLPNAATQVSGTNPHARDTSMPVPPTTGRPPFIPPWAPPPVPPPPSSGSLNSWNQNVISHQHGSRNVPMIWESAANAKPPPSWENGPPPQQAPSVWQVPTGPPWERGAPSRPPTASGQSPSPPWEMKQKPWEFLPHRPPPLPSQSPASVQTVAPPPIPTIGPLNPSWSPSHPPPPPLPPLPPLPPPQNHPWKVPPPQNPQQYLPPGNFPSSGSGPPPPWRGPPLSPAAVPMLTSKPPAPPQSPQITASPQSRQSSSPPFPPWHPQAQQNPNPNAFTNFGSSKMVPGSLPHPPLSGATWGHRPGADPARLDPRPPLPPPPPIPSHSDRGANPPPSYEPFAPPLAAAVVNNSSMHQHQHQGPMPMLGVSAPPGFVRVPDPNVGRSQPGLPAGRPPWQNMDSPGQNPRSAPPVLPPAPPAAQEVDAEYEKLMASVGVK